MGVNSLPKTVTGQRRGCDLNPGPSAPESSTLTTRLPSHPRCSIVTLQYALFSIELEAWDRQTDRQTDGVGEGVEILLYCVMVGDGVLESVLYRDRYGPAVSGPAF